MLIKYVDDTKQAVVANTSKDKIRIQYDLNVSENCLKTGLNMETFKVPHLDRKGAQMQDGQHLAVCEKDPGFLLDQGSTLKKLPQRI